MAELKVWSGSCLVVQVGSRPSLTHGYMEPGADGLILITLDEPVELHAEESHRIVLAPDEPRVPRTIADVVASEGNHLTVRPVRTVHFERRASPRYPAELRVFFQRRHMGDPVASGPCVDVSLGGVAILTDVPLRVGDELDVAFTVPGDRTPTHATCHVVRVEASDEEMTRASLAVDPDAPSARWALARLIGKIQGTMLRRLGRNVVPLKSA